jgi:hypothetical protein
MKRIIGFLIVAGLVACDCLSQLPIQTIYVGESCEAPLPDYRDAVIARDNCVITSLVQSPLPGTVLDAGNPYVNVTIVATDLSNNKSSVNIDVVIVDTTPPIMEIDTSLLTYTWDDRFGLLDAFQASVNSFISDSVSSTHNLVMISTPDQRHFGGWYLDKYMVPLDEADLGSLEPNTLINAGMENEEYLTQTAGGWAVNDTLFMVEWPFNMYNSERYGNFSYRIPMRVGWYVVDLYFAEIYWHEAGRRIFDVSIEGQKVIDDLDLFVESGGFGKSYWRGFSVDVQDGWLDIDFASEEDYAKLSAIHIRHVTRDRQVISQL